MSARRVGSLAVALVAQCAAARRGLPEPCLNIFVAGVEGAGHHGAVFAFLRPILDLVLPSQVSVSEMPGYHSTGNLSKCARSAEVGWESFPAGHRVSELSRLTLLYRDKACFGGDKWPGSWRAAGTSAKVSCLRCGGVVPTYVEAVDRFDKSDRLPLVPFQAQYGLKIVFLMRGFEATVSSHDVDDGGAIGHAIVMAAHLTLLARDAQSLPPDSWRVLWYEMLDTPEGFVEAAIGVVQFLASACVNPAKVADIAGVVLKDKWRHPSAVHKATATTLTPQLQVVRALDHAVSANWSIFNEPDRQIVADFLPEELPRGTTSQSKKPLHNESTLAALLYGPDGSPSCVPMDVQVCRRGASRTPTYPPHTQRLCNPHGESPK